MAHRPKSAEPRLNLLWPKFEEPNKPNEKQQHDLVVWRPSQSGVLNSEILGRKSLQESRPRSSPWFYLPVSNGNLKVGYKSQTNFSQKGIQKSSLLKRTKTLLASRSPEINIHDHHNHCSAQAYLRLSIQTISLIYFFHCSSVLWFLQVIRSVDQVHLQGNSADDNRIHKIQPKLHWA